MKLWQKILIAMVLGVVVGGALRFADLAFGTHLLGIIVYIQPLGDLFISLIQMLVELLIFSSLTLGITSIHDPQKLGRVGLRTLVTYFVTTLIAIGIGMGLAMLIGPGVGVDASSVGAVGGGDGQTTPAFFRAILDMIPRHPVGLAEGNVLQIIIFSVFLGISINFAGDRGKPLLELLESVADVMYRLTAIIMEFAPIGAFAAMTWAVGQLGASALWALSKFLLTVWAASAIQVGVVFVLMLVVLARLRPGSFFRGMGDAMALAFSTSSSSAALPVTMHCVQENLGVSKNISGFVLPLGSTVNMNGTAIYQGVAALFIAQVYHVDLSWGTMITIALTASISAIGAAGIPGTGFLMLNLVLEPIGLPAAQLGQGLGMLLGVDRLREMVTTVVNILGDSVVAVQVARSEGEFNEDQYYHTELVEMEDDGL